MEKITQAVEAGKKCVIFSHFHTMILLLEHDLEQSEINFLVYTFSFAKFINSNERKLMLE